MDKIKKKSTLDNILDVAHDLFLNRGFSATSVDEICRKAKVTKGGLFHYFKSKECLGKIVLKRFCSSARDMMREAGCCEKLSDPLDRVFATLDCIPGNLVGDTPEDLLDEMHLRLRGINVRDEESSA